ncbi:MAG: hypothetical protein JO116_10415, partial [Planctomycetaceae bacterium]|nr:hypothetical protein [Planctomycetaceae bacterium]
PQLSFAEMAELARGPGAAARRLAEILASVVGHPEAGAEGPKGRPTKAAKVKGKGRDQGKTEG